MEDPKDCLAVGVSTAELERRWSLTREMMRSEKIDFLVMRADEEFLGGYVRWFTDIPARHNYPYTAVFPVDDEMTLVSPGSFAPAESGPPAWAVRGVKKRFGAPYFPSVNYTGTYDAEIVAGVLKEKKDAKIGLVGKSYFPLNFYECLVKELPSATFVDASDQIDQFKAIKSAEEIKFIKLAAEMQDEVIGKISKMIKPGMREFEIYAEALYHTSLLGSARGLNLVGSGPQGTPVPFKPRHFQNRVINDGEQVAVLIEMNGPGGFYTEISRIFTLGKACQELQDAFGVAVEAQALTLSLLKPGADPKELWDANNEFLVGKGYFPEARLYAHGQGYDLVERPLVRLDEPMKIENNMSIVVHPTAVNATVCAGVTDNYLTTENGVSSCLHKTPKKIIEL